NPIMFSGGTNIDVNYAYYVDRIEDRYGNSIRVKYANTRMGTSPPVSQVQELVPSTITWGPTLQRSVSFAYEPLPNGASVNPQLRWVHGLGIGQTPYLTTITINGPDGLGGTPVLKSYGFTYDTKAWPGGPDIITGDRVLSSI